MAGFSTISIRFNADLKQFSSEMQNANRSMQKMGKRMTSVGQNMTIGLTAPIVAFGYKAAQAFNTQAQAIAQVEAGVKSTGAAAGFATGQLLKMASDLQNKTLFGDEEILKGATAQLLTFTNIAGEQFGRTQLAALNLATRLDGDLKSASIQLGKALNDPIANLSALSRSGIQFAEDQKAVIKSFTESGRLAEAQTIILDELEKQYGGAAEAAAKAGTGGFTQLSNILGDIMEEFGAIVVEMLNPLIAKLKSAALAFQSLSPQIKKIIVVVAAFAAAIGPILLTLGFLMTTVIPGLIAALPALGVAFTALTGPIGLVVAAVAGIGYAIYEYWDEIKVYMRQLQNYFIDLYNEAVVFRIAVDTIGLTFKRIWNIVKVVFGSIWEIIKGSGNLIIDTFKNAGAAIKAILTGDIGALPGIIKEQGKVMAANFADTFSNIGDEISSFSENMKRDISTAVDSATTRKNIAFSETNVDASAINNAVANAVVTGIAEGGSGRGQVQSVGNVESVGMIQQGPLDLIAATMPEQVNMIDQEQARFLENALIFNENLTGIMQNTAANFAEGFGQMIGSAAEGGLTLQSLGNLMLGTLADMAVQVGKMAIGIGLAVEGIKKALQSLAGPVAIAAGVALIALGTFAKSALSNVAGGDSTARAPRRVALATGGIAYGPTNALIGEYSGASSNPEIVAPLDRLRAMIADVVPGGGDVRVRGEFRLRNNELVAAVDSGNKYMGRRK